jgi:hypothetical protein
MRETLWRSRISTLVAVLVIMFGFPKLPQASNWWENIKIEGDFRYRHEMIDKEGKDIRHRHRLRARLSVFAKANDMIDIGIRMATGSNDPVSTNQTLDNAFSTKDFRLDMAYFNLYHEKVPDFRTTAGKFKNPFFKPGKSELIWDSDWNPEGGAATFHHDLNNVAVTLIGAGLWIEEHSSSDDSYLAAGQGVGRLYFNEKNSSVAFGAGYFNYVNAKGYAPFFDAEDPVGNSVVEAAEDGDTVLCYANEFELLELFVEATHKLDNVPITVMGDFVTNTAADSLETGWLVGLRIGKAKKPGTWEFRYTYREVEKDAVVGVFADSDFRGGGTDAKGHEVGGAYQLAKNAAFKVTYFLNEIGLEELKTEDFNRLQVDLQFEF